MNDAPRPSPLLKLSRIGHVYSLPSGKTLPVLSGVNLTLQEGELVAILGPSGCGKSTLIRIAAGLARPTHGEVAYRGVPVEGPNPRVALVFQQFALFPWLTVAQNIEQALIPLSLEPAVRRGRVVDAISLIGLDGFEDTYPRELSGGMKQRVGIARALAVQPELLCMDEPFSQVDALTAETLRTEVVNLWRDREKYPQSIFLVSHDIHEVAFMASRILVMAANPGRLKTVIENPLPYPRDVRSPGYQALVERLHGVITGLYLPERDSEARPVTILAELAGIQVMAPIPLVGVREIIGLLEAVGSRGGDVTFFRLTTELGRAFTRTLLAVKAAELLGFLETPQDRLVLTELGRQMVVAPRKIRKHLFRGQLLQVPLVKRLLEMLAHHPAHRVSKDVLLEDVAIQCPQEDPKRLLGILINWGRFADVWVYQPAQGTLELNGNSHAPVPDAAPPAPPPSA